MTRTEPFFSKHGILSNEEFACHLTVDYANYSAAALLEGQCLRDMANKDIIPAAISYQKRVTEAAGPKGLQTKLSKLVEDAFQLSEKLSSVCAQLSAMSDEVESARFALKSVIPATKELRTALDSLEDIVDRREWPYPSYEELLLSRNAKERGE